MFPMVQSHLGISGKQSAPNLKKNVDYYSIGHKTTLVAFMCCCAERRLIHHTPDTHLDSFSEAPNAGRS